MLVRTVEQRTRRAKPNSHLERDSAGHALTVPFAGSAWYWQAPDIAGRAITLK